MTDIITTLARELKQPEQYVRNVVQLLDEGNTIPFIARYRKELHGSMDDTALRTLADRLTYLRNLAQRKEEVKNVSRGSVADYQADERAEVARLRWRVSGR